MTTQHDPSPCCQAPLMWFMSGGSEINGIKGAYVMCHKCGKKFQVNYSTGVLNG